MVESKSPDLLECGDVGDEDELMEAPKLTRKRSKVEAQAARLDKVMSKASSKVIKEPIEEGEENEEDIENEEEEEEELEYCPDCDEEIVWDCQCHNSDDEAEEA
jgi:uncharacterized protein YhaN